MPHRRSFTASGLLAVVALLFAPALLGQSADLGIAKLGPAFAAAGSDVAYTITLQNAGPNDAMLVGMNDNVPAGMTFVSLANDPAFTCSTPPVGSAGLVSCSSPVVTVGTSAVFTLVLNIPPATPPGTTFTNIANVFAETPPDPNSENDSAAAATTVPIPSADIYVVKSGPPFAGPNTDVSYDITVGNGGPDANPSVALADTLPGTMTFVSLAQNNGSAFGCTPPPVGSGGTVTCTGALAAGQSANFTLVGHIPTGTPSGTTFSNTAAQTSSTSDPDQGNDSSTAITVVQVADLSMTKTGSASATAGGTITYALTVTNGGPDAAVNVVLSDPLPAGTTFVSLVQNTGPAFGCSTPAPGLGGPVTCSGATLNNGASASFTLVVDVAPSVPAGTNLTNTAAASADTFDPNGTNNGASAGTIIGASADLAVAKTGPPTVTAGANGSFTLTITNNGPSDAQNVSLADTLPPGTTFVSETQTSGPVFACAAGTCTIASFAAGASAAFTLTVQVPATTPNGTVLTNTVTGTSTTPDPTPGNNTGTATTTVAASADLAVTKTGPGSAPAGSSVTYTITLTNLGPSAAQTVSLTDTIPASTTFVSETQASGPAFACVGSTCAIASFAAGASAVFSVVVTVNAGTPTGTTLTNSVVASSVTPDPVPGNNTASAITGVAPVTTIPTLPPGLLLLMALGLAGTGWWLMRVR